MPENTQDSLTQLVTTYIPGYCLASEEKRKTFEKGTPFQNWLTAHTHLSNLSGSPRLISQTWDKITGNSHTFTLAVNNSAMFRKINTDITATLIRSFRLKAPILTHSPYEFQIHLQRIAQASQLPFGIPAPANPDKKMTAELTQIKKEVEYAILRALQITTAELLEIFNITGGSQNHITLCQKIHTIKTEFAQSLTNIFSEVAWTKDVVAFQTATQQWHSDYRNRILSLITPYLESMPAYKIAMSFPSCPKEIQTQFQILLDNLVLSARTTEKEVTQAIQDITTYIQKSFVQHIQTEYPELSPIMDHMAPIFFADHTTRSTALMNAFQASGNEFFKLLEQVMPSDILSNTKAEIAQINMQYAKELAEIPEALKRNMDDASFKTCIYQIRDCKKRYEQATWQAFGSAPDAQTFDIQRFLAKHIPEYSLACEKDKSALENNYTLLFMDEASKSISTEDVKQHTQDLIFNVHSTLLNPYIPGYALASEKTRTAFEGQDVVNLWLQDKMAAMMSTSPGWIASTLQWFLQNAQYPNVHIQEQCSKHLKEVVDSIDATIIECFETQYPLIAEQYTKVLTSLLSNTQTQYTFDEKPLNLNPKAQAEAQAGIATNLTNTLLPILEIYAIFMGREKAKRVETALDTALNKHANHLSKILCRLACTKDIPIFKTAIDGWLGQYETDLAKVLVDIMDLDSFIPHIPGYTLFATDNQDEKTALDDTLKKHLQTLIDAVLFKKTSSEVLTTLVEDLAILQETIYKTMVAHFKTTCPIAHYVLKEFDSSSSIPEAVIRNRLATLMQPSLDSFKMILAPTEYTKLVAKIMLLQTQYAASLKKHIDAVNTHATIESFDGQIRQWETSYKQAISKLQAPNPDLFLKEYIPFYASVSYAHPEISTILKTHVTSTFTHMFHIPQDEVKVGVDTPYQQKIVDAAAQLHIAVNAHVAETLLASHLKSIQKATEEDILKELQKQWKALSIPAQKSAKTPHPTWQALLKGAQSYGNVHAFMQYTGFATKGESWVGTILDTFNYVQHQESILEFKGTIKKLLYPFLPLLHEYHEIAQYEKNPVLVVVKSLIPLILVAAVVTGIALLFTLFPPIPELVFLVVLIPSLFLGLAVASAYVYLKNSLFMSIRQACYGGAFKIPEYQVNAQMITIFGDKDAHYIRNFYIEQLQVCKKALDKKGPYTATELKAHKQVQDKRETLLKEWFQIQNSPNKTEIQKLVKARLAAEHQDTYTATLATLPKVAEAVTVSSEEISTSIAPEAKVAYANTIHTFFHDQEQVVAKHGCYSRIVVTP